MFLVRVMMKGLLQSCEPESTVTYLQKQGFKVTEAIDKLHYKTKNSLNMFIVCFESMKNIEKSMKLNTF